MILAELLRNILYRSKPTQILLDIKLMLIICDINLGYVQFLHNKYLFKLESFVREKESIKRIQCKHSQLRKSKGHPPTTQRFLSFPRGFWWYRTGVVAAHIIVQLCIRDIDTHKTACSLAACWGVMQHSQGSSHLASLGGGRLTGGWCRLSPGILLCRQRLAQGCHTLFEREKMKNWPK